MASPCRGASLASLACCAAALVACSANAPAVWTCATSEECPATARCISNACVADAPPSTAVALPPAPLETNVLLAFDASATADPDAGDSVAGFAWAFRALSGQPCAAPAVAGTVAVANVRFGCPGRYAVDVTATDRLGVASTATREFDVSAYAGAALLTVGGDVVVGHVCNGTPWCIPSGPVALSASTPGTPANQVQFAWTVEPPPDRPLAASRRVSFSPSAAVASPGVVIETDGDAISGDWIFHVVASDAAGPIGTQAVRVSVGNRPPDVTETIPITYHTFDGAQLTAGGEIPFTVSDPDGDRLEVPSVEWHHVSDGGAVFTGVPLGAPSRVTFSIVVPYTSFADSAWLIGPSVERSIRFGISDVNGGKTDETWPVVVTNRPPVLVSAPSGVTVGHVFDAARSEYRATAPLSTWSDPDGDALIQVPGSSTGDPLCGSFDVTGGTAMVHCGYGFSTFPVLEALAGPHAVRQEVQDFWDPAAGSSTVGFTITNRPPVIASTAVESVGSCNMTSSCCRVFEGVCDLNYGEPPSSTTVSSRWTDPDGDPLSVQVTATGIYTPDALVCAPPACDLHVEIAPAQVCGTSAVTSLPTTVTDGVASVSGSLPLQLICY